ncbi:MAG: hypothetical protein IPM52_11235 [Bacteroidetes bacterium]|nr:hypothetical protein [Bacteroidota bacterium]
MPSVWPSPWVEENDTIACITGGLAFACYKTMPEKLEHFVAGKLPQEFQELISAFDQKFKPLG